MTNIHHTTHFSTKRRELRHEDFWNTRHRAPRRPFRSAHLERCVTNIHPYSLFLHEATGASSRRLLKHTAHSATPSVSKCASWALRHQYTPCCRRAAATIYIVFFVHLIWWLSPSSGGILLVGSRVLCRSWFVRLAESSRRHGFDKDGRMEFLVVNINVHLSEVI